MSRRAAAAPRPWTRRAGYADAAPEPPMSSRCLRRCRVWRPILIRGPTAAPDAAQDLWTGGPPVDEPRCRSDDLVWRLAGRLEDPLWTRSAAERSSRRAQANAVSLQVVLQEVTTGRRPGQKVDDPRPGGDGGRRGAAPGGSSRSHSAVYGGVQPPRACFNAQCPQTSRTLSNRSTRYGAKRANHALSHKHARRNLMRRVVAGFNTPMKIIGQKFAAFGHCSAAASPNVGRRSDCPRSP